MRKIANCSDSAHNDFIVGLFEEDLPTYIEILKEFEERGNDGWAHDQEFFQGQYKPGYEEKKACKKVVILDDLVKLGYINFLHSTLYNVDEEVKGSCSAYKISPKGKNLLKKIKQISEKL